MAARGPQALDRWIGSVEIEQGKNALRIFNGLSNATIEIPPGTYWCHGDDDAALNTKYPGLYTVLQDLVGTAAIWSGATFHAWSPYQRRPGCGLQLVGNPHAFLFSSPLFTFPKDLLGWPVDWATDTPAGTVTRSPQSCRGVWVSPEGAWDKRSWASHTSYHSSPDEPERDDLYQLRWGSRRTRLIEYSWLPAALVHKGRARLPEYARTAQLAVGDVAAAFEHLWERMARLDTVLVVHDEGAACGLEVVAHPWEAARLATTDAATRYEALCRLLATGGEQYALTVPLVRLEGSYEQ